ncbi:MULTISPECIES: hypothetical protein [Nocardiaceae]|uniref:hypothetical protein n=1 Tax=Nocardiaceae TaxID=85025 RepID=UPI0007AAC968|nr:MULTISPECIES: hypothetical protein [Rhodococcus]AMY56269.1 hypothetical protein A3L23_04971 [Rhodococcus fascians D188]
MPTEKASPPPHRRERRAPWQFHPDIMPRADFRAVQAEDPQTGPIDGAIDTGEESE